MRSVAHSYALGALTHITQVEKQPSISKDYGRLCLSFPTLVQVNGLRLAVAFYQSKAEGNRDSAHGQYLSNLGDTIGFTLWDVKYIFPEKFTAYSSLSKQALAASVWYKRYAEAILKVDVTDLDN